MKSLVDMGLQEMTWGDEPGPIENSGEVEVIVDPLGICGFDMYAHDGHDERWLGHEACIRATSGWYKGKRVVI